MSRNIELIKVGEKGLRTEIYGTSIRDIHGREWVLTDKGAYISFEIQSKLPFKWLQMGWEKMSSWQLKTVNWLNMTCRNRLTMIPMPEGANPYQPTEKYRLPAPAGNQSGCSIYNPRTFKFEIINVQSPTALAEVKKIYTDDFA